MLLVGFPVHEFSHALAAYRLGDGTAKLFGRLTLNPIAHVDPRGTILMPAIMLPLSGGSFALGYAKPVQTDPRRMPRVTLPTGKRLTDSVAPAANLLHPVSGGARYRA